MRKDNFNNRISKQIAYEEKWVNRNIPDMINQSYPKLFAKLKIGDRDNLAMSQTQLMLLSTSFGSQGLVSVLNDDDTGWLDIYKSIQYQMAELRIGLLIVFQRKGYFTYDPINLSNLLCAAIVYDLSEEEDFFATNYQRMLITPGAIFRPEYFWNKRQFEPFVYKLYATFGTDRLNPLLVKDDFGLYSEVFTNWQHPEKLAETLSLLCDYHCKNMFDNGGLWKPEFAFPPFELVPFEILAIYKLRDRLGLPTPSIKHPLMETGLAKFYPETFDLSDDVILPQVRLLCDKIFANV